MAASGQEQIEKMKLEILRREEKINSLQEKIVNEQEAIKKLEERIKEETNQLILKMVHNNGYNVESLEELFALQMKLKQKETKKDE